MAVTPLTDSHMSDVVPYVGDTQLVFFLAEHKHSAEGSLAVRKCPAEHSVAGTGVLSVHGCLVWLILSLRIVSRS